MSEIALADPPKIETDAKTGQKIYRPAGRVLAHFLADESHVSLIRGPIGSGTSAACCMKIFKLAMAQHPGPDGVRRTRWVVVRNTFPDLRGTTVKTWLDWFPEDVYGRFYWDRPFRHIVKIADVEMEVWFIALDSPDDVRKMRSLEVTGFWFNELEFIDKALVDEAESRTGRFPAVKDGGCRWDGVLGDMNAPNEDHWVPLMMGEVPFPDHWSEDERQAFRQPPNWSYFVQPPALIEQKAADGSIAGYDVNPDAENVIWLKPGFYQEKRFGKSKQWIDSRLMNRITIYVEGDPVWKNFSLETHVAKAALKPIPGWKVFVGLDFGRNPAAVFGQEINGRWSIQRELIGRAEGASEFAPKVQRVLTQHYDGFEIEIYGDPKGQDGVQTDETTAYEVYRSHGMIVHPAPVKQNNIQTRIDAVDFVLRGMSNGLPRFLLDPWACRTLKVGMAGGYHMQKTANLAMSEPKPVKDKYSDVCDALQYMMLGAGEGRSMTRGEVGGRSQPVRYAKKKKGLRRYAAG